MIVEDGALARAGLLRLLARHEDVDVVGAAATIADAVMQVAALRPDLAILDIELPDGTGLALARELNPRPAIIFLTAFPDHALSAFGVEALDYLLKPASAEDVARALDRVRRALAMYDAPPQPPTRLEIRDGARTSFVPLVAIDYIDAAGHYLCVHAQGEVHLLRTPIAELTERLGSEFVRVHRSAIVRLDRVSAIADRRNGDGDIHLINGAMVTLSRTYRADLENRMSGLRR